MCSQSSPHFGSSHRGVQSVHMQYAGHGSVQEEAHPGHPGPDPEQAEAHQSARGVPRAGGGVPGHCGHIQQHQRPAAGESQRTGSDV